MCHNSVHLSLFSSFISKSVTCCSLWDFLTTHQLSFSKQSLCAEQVTDTSSVHIWINSLKQADFWTAGKARTGQSEKHKLNQTQLEALTTNNSVNTNFSQLKTYNTCKLEFNSNSEQ